MTPNATVKCDRCRIDVPVRALGARDRCLDPDCPLKGVPRPAEQYTEPRHDIS